VEVPGVAATASTTSTSAKSMETAVAGLEARLARGGGTEADWTLLAKAYDFLGRPEDARRARQRIPSPGAGKVTPMGSEALVAAAAAMDSPTDSTERVPTAAAAPPTLAELQQHVKQNPRDAQSWLALADSYRAQRDNRAAANALAKVVALNGMSAQSWADYADVLGSLNGGSLTGAAAGNAIDHALALDPANSKALWLKASQAHEQRNFTAALMWWKTLRGALPADSPDARIIDGNIAEDTALAATVSPQSATAPTVAALVPTPTAEVSGTVSLDSHLADRVQRDATLFIYAKAADSPGPPLAVIRTTAAAWPVSFRLDDSMAMIPSRRLSQFDKVVVEARISRSGQAAPSSGDLYATSPVLYPRTGKKLTLVINREIG